MTATGRVQSAGWSLAAHQFIGLLNEFSLWPWMTGRERLPVAAADIIDETVRMFLQHYRRRRSSI